MHVNANQIIQDQIQCVQMEFTWSIERNKLSKVFKCLSYEFLIALFDSDWLEIISLRLIHDHLSNKKQRVKAKSKYNSRRK